MKLLSSAADVALLTAGLEAWLKPLDGLPLECDGMTRCISMLLQRESIPHEIATGAMKVRGRGDIGLHYWIELAGGVVCDFRARMWLGPFPEIPHGVFVPGPEVQYEAHAKASVFPAEARAKSVLFVVLAGMDLDSYPSFSPLNAPAGPMPALEPAAP